MWCMTLICGSWSAPATRRSSSHGPFLYRTALNLVIDDHRRNALRQVESLDVLDNEERYFTPSPLSSLSITVQRLDMLQRALAELPRLCRESFLLRKIEGLSHPEIAEQPRDFQGVGREAHRQCDEALPGAHAAMGRALICVP
jgi:DNA-directed RNA polymerase specialized sigma24 family protein